MGGRAIEHMKINIRELNWFSTYRAHHRVAEHFRLGRAFLLGDAAHIYSPAGGEGMNPGISDAINLAWKLAAVLGDFTPDFCSQSSSRSSRSEITSLGPFRRWL